MTRFSEEGMMKAVRSLASWLVKYEWVEDLVPGLFKGAKHETSDRMNEYMKDFSANLKMGNWISYGIPKKDKMVLHKVMQEMQMGDDYTHTSQRNADIAREVLDIPYPKSRRRYVK